MTYLAKKISHTTQLRTAKEPVEAVMLEKKIEAMIANEEPIIGTAELIYTKKRDGVLPAYDPRTDRFDNAIEAINNITMAAMAKRQELSQKRDEESKQKETKVIETETPKKE